MTLHVLRGALGKASVGFRLKLLSGKPLTLHPKLPKPLSKSGWGLATEFTSSDSCGLGLRGFGI